MKVIRTAIPDVLVIEPRVFGDDRGYLFESFNERAIRDVAGVSANFVQDNHSRSVRSTLRGLHYQIRQPQVKVLRVVVGEILDVVVDIRRSSPTFGKWVSVRLSAENKRMIWIPAGFAHGFTVLSDVADCLYKVSDYWAPQFERTILWNDPDLAIDWQLAGEPILAAKDKVGTRFADAEVFD